MCAKELRGRTIWLSVWHSDLFGKNDFLGEVVLPVAELDLEEAAPKWYQLQDRVRSITFILASLR